MTHEPVHQWMFHPICVTQDHPASPVPVQVSVSLNSVIAFQRVLRGIGQIPKQMTPISDLDRIRRTTP